MRKFGHLSGTPFSELSRGENWLTCEYRAKVAVEWQGGDRRNLGKTLAKSVLNIIRAFSYFSTEAITSIVNGGLVSIKHIS